MKKIIIIAIMAAVAVSCNINMYGPESRNNRNGYALAKYSEEILDKFAVSQTDNLIYLMALDEFLKLSPEEQSKPQWAEFKSKIEHYSETAFRITSKGIRLDTKGLSLTEPGTSWLIEVIDDWNFCGIDGSYNYWLGNFGNIPGHSNYIRISCTAENKYEITDGEGGKEVMLLEIEAIPSQHGGYDFSATGSGKILANKRELSAAYKLSDLYYRKHRSDVDGTGNSSVTVSYEIEALNLRLETFHKGLALDWCEIFKSSEDDGPEYSSNLEFNEEDYYNYRY